MKNLRCYKTKQCESDVVYTDELRNFFYFYS